MEEMFQSVRAFLAAPEEEQDAFDASDAVIWVDWGESDDVLLAYLSDVLPEEAQIDYEYTDSSSERGFDILLKKNGETYAIPYAEGAADRDTTLKAAQEFIAPAYEIRWYMVSLGCDTLAFCVLEAEQWKRLAQEFGAETVDYYFAPITADSKIFAMDGKEVARLLREREG